MGHRLWAKDISHSPNFSAYLLASKNALKSLMFGDSFIRLLLCEESYALPRVLEVQFEVLKHAQSYIPVEEAVGQRSVLGVGERCVYLRERSFAEGERPDRPPADRDMVWADAA